MTEFVVLLGIFLATGVGFLAVNMLVGKLIRPSNPGVEKGEVYDCGEEAVGSAWIRFDLRFYVVALLFVIFDVEMAFFFPWATVFGSATTLANSETTPERQAQVVQMLTNNPAALPGDPAAAQSLAWLAFGDLLVFFAVLLVGFAYLWRRGDLAWVRAVSGDNAPAPNILPGG